VSSASRRRTRSVLRPLALAAPLFVALQARAAPDAAADAPAGDTVLPAVKVTARPDRATEGTGSYTTRSASTATKLDLTLRETPQSITVVPRSLIDDFVLNDVNDLLAGVTGVNVERVEPDRTYFSVRGFEVSNFQIDGVGLPFATGDQIGNLDTALYDRVEVLRGANGLMSSTGNPSATVNFVRKRPTTEFRAGGALTVGSWNRRRVDADVSGALNAAGTVRGRFTAAAQEGDSYLDRYSLKKHLFSGVVDIDLAPGTTLTLGHSEQHNRPNGVMWGTLPLFDSDGSPTNYATSASSAPSWTFWDTDDTQTFGELTHRLAGDWRAKATLTRRVLKSDAELFFVIGQPDAATGAGLLSWPSKYNSKETQWIADAHVSGPFTLGGRRHELVLGANWGKSENALRSSDDGSAALTESEMLAGSASRPAFDKGITGSADFDNRRTTLYAVGRFDVTDALKLITGANVARVSSSGLQYTLKHDYRETKATPYVGATWALDARHSLYASHGGIYNPQYQLDETGKVLDPIEGSNTELGVKGEWMDGKLNGSFAVFRVEQDNLAESAGFVPGIGSVYRAIDATSTGFELDVAGTLAPGWELSGGYTQLRIVDPDGNGVRKHVPRKTLRATTSYRLPALSALKVGASLKWQSDFEREDGTVTTRQAAFALLDLAATYEFTRQLSLTAKVENVTDKRYLNSLMWPNQSFYGAPRNGSLTLKWTY
jgi:outer membrane receptor for ferric coprogen and ferric-rhodotorulic acid